MIKKLRVTVDGKPYDVTVEVPDDQSAPIAPASAPKPPPPVVAPNPVATPLPPPQASSAGAPSGGVLSPLAGHVISIAIKIGQIVQANENLLTLEAMKMNTSVLALEAGKVVEIPVAVGDAVNEGQMLVRIE
jgi:glutaconyl-CoA/methylmalonyl-CoA decarboxylase subunit gamma